MQIHTLFCNSIGSYVHCITLVIAANKNIAKEPFFSLVHHALSATAAHHLSPALPQSALVATSAERTAAQAAAAAA